MESKKKKKIAIIVTIVSLVLIVAILGVFFAVQKINTNKQNSNNASNVNNSPSSDDKLFWATVAIIEEKVPQNYDGNFVFKDIILNINSFHKDLDHEQITSIVKSKGASDVNGLRKILLDAKNKEVASNKEVLSFKNGKYTKTINKTRVVEKGVFYGNDDLSEVRILKDGKYTPSFNISLNIDEQQLISTPSISTNPTGTKLYVYRNFYSNSDDTLVLFTATYVYEMVVDNSKPIPDSKLDFDI